MTNLSNSSLTPAVSVICRGGRTHQVPVSLDLYEAAAKAGQSVPDYFREQYGKDADPNYANGDAFLQALASVGLDLTDKRRGFRSMSYRSVMNNDFSAATTANQQEAARILSVAAVLELVKENPTRDIPDEFSLFEKMLALDVEITSRSFEYPIFNTSNATEQMESVTSQLATPNIVGQLTVSDKAYKIPSYAFGVEVSDEASRALTIDNVTLYLNDLKRELSYKRLMAQFSRLINGDVDLDMKALQPTPFTQFDPTATTGKVTHRGWLKWLRWQRISRRIDYVLCDFDTYMEIINRDGRPTIVNQPVTVAEIGAYPAKPINLGMYEPQLFILDDGIIPTGMFVGLDSRIAVARVSNLAANYEATRDIVMRRGQQMRFDHGEVVYRHKEAAWSAVTLV